MKLYVPSLVGAAGLWARNLSNTPDMSRNAQRFAERADWRRWVGLRD
ncbi:hypothetical protein SynBMKMC1_02824 [Synechococcus sp. BMK-MC-1]|nr:hypothetical protein SynBMKMC1_02824 [Synechococcus sp. BMK-MC-1]